MSAELVTHIDQCLGCMACVTACPSGVQYDKLIEDTRAQVERNTDARPGRPPLPALRVRELHPPRPVARAGAAARRRPPPRPRPAPPPRARRSPASRGCARSPPSRRARRSARRCAGSRGPSRRTGPPRARVALLQGCVQRVFFRDVNVATARVLAAEGFAVTALREPRCCGALQLHSGYDEEAAELAKLTIAAFEDYDLVAVNAAGCGSAMKDYGHLLRDDSEWAERAAAFSATGARRDGAAARGRPEGPAPPGAAEGRIPRRLPPGARAGRPDPAPRAPGPDPGARAGRARRVGAVLRLGRRLQHAAARARRRARPAQGPQPARHRGRGRDRGQSGLRAADRRAQREAGPAAARLPPDGAAV